MKPIRGFTLAELLIALAILGEIATFTIPKILSAQQNGANKTKAKEVAAMITNALQQARLDGSLSSSTKPSDLTSYMNYVSVDSAGTLIDARPTLSSNTCNSAGPCLVLHNGGKLQAATNHSFNGINATNFIEFVFDPDGVYSGSTADGPSKSVQFSIMANGRIVTRTYLPENSYYSGGGPYGPLGSNQDPSWFSW